ncbi:Crp/Fnr family transcriptional regulator [Desertivirga brevis]|uniref:Crp/Fnr family transcriptional regulator n=1 Tax=Desertivirga brevis TaxID=2810310 RepID=UPI001A9779F2|nr:Crp/Fnr family transcriptional regulator [Pedobacter sp. SYSU D00873]
MLRTNQAFLAYAEDLYEKQERKEDIVVRRYAAGQTLLCQGEPAIKIMVIREGISKCFFTENNDKDYILEFLGRGEIIGEIEFLRNLPCLCNVVAMTEVSVFAFSIPYFQYLIESDLKLNRLLLDVFAERITNTSSRASYQQLHPAEYSLRKLLELQSKQGIKLSKEDMASYLGISVRSLNRSLKEMGITS